MDFRTVFWIIAELNLCPAAVTEACNGNHGGKPSLIQAGLIPTLRRGRFEYGTEHVDDWRIKAHQQRCVVCATRAGASVPNRPILQVEGCGTPVESSVLLLFDTDLPAVRKPATRSSSADRQV